MKKETTFKKERNKRYYLHQKVRTQGFKLDAHKRTIFVEPNSLISTSVATLRDKYGYNLQVEIPYSVGGNVV